VEGRFQKRIYIKSSIIKKVLCQIINYLISQMVMYHGLVVIDGGKLIEKMDAPDYRLLATVRHKMMID